ncbi:FxsB family cyclophane-forming radical SAM/SPASM peptide maturase [Micromonospora endophytica]|uniref:Radical SAM protein n=1 Tax=Micromonospora endophytica TaxID=515350 RepID=A0A2W2DMC0_9ACTN|nr:FxsB family cyclophane-forming radical SAM/SPASM peptide maturase [Micromonospora endophytica]PZF98276.1 radical SAM protein [Micromonospora endophytica]RIW42759.1 FxsB family radical SAM/SPASM domain protein [Micromonospora endophytica]BCJ62747.1 radical SAM protein [Micromonospora endophytica]
MPGCDDVRRPAGDAGSAPLRSQAVAFRQFVLKLHSRCDLACDHCYMYTMADQRWRTLPRVMPRPVREAAARRIGEHARAHGLRRVEVILHGGEPLLAGPAVIAQAVATFRREAAPVPVRVTVQTNATRLDETYLRLLDRLDVRISVSLDGDRAAHDRHRRGPDGSGSHDRVDAALRLLTTRHAHLFHGLLCTVDLRNDPLATYRALMAYQPPAIDFLLPHGTWSTPPPGRSPDDRQTPYARWLTTIFDRWYDDPGPPVRIRLFDEIIQVLLGGTSRLTGVGTSPVAVAVVQTDGAIELDDTLAAAYDGAARTGLHVDRDPFDAALALPTVRQQQAGPAGLCPTCRACDLGRVCGGGLRTHRYRAGGGFANPSVYCPDLYALIRHIRRTVARDVAAWVGAAR